MPYRYRVFVRTALEPEASAAVSRAHLRDEQASKGSLIKAIKQVSYMLPLGTELKIEKVYRMQRGYEPGKPRSGEVVETDEIKLVKHGAFYDPKTGRPSDPIWQREKKPEHARTR